MVTRTSVWASVWQRRSNGWQKWVQLVKHVPQGQRKIHDTCVLWWFHVMCSGVHCIWGRVSLLLNMLIVSTRKMTLRKHHCSILPSKEQKQLRSPLGSASGIRQWCSAYSWGWGFDTEGLGQECQAWPTMTGSRGFVFLWIFFFGGGSPYHPGISLWIYVHL